MDYELIQSTNPEFNKAVVRVSVFREHRQTIQVRLKLCPYVYRTSCGSDILVVLKVK